MSDERFTPGLGDHVAAVVRGKDAMPAADAIAMAVRALRRGSCSAHKLATEGCATCEASERAIETLRGLR